MNHGSQSGQIAARSAGNISQSASASCLFPHSESQSRPCPHCHHPGNISCGGVVGRARTGRVAGFPCEEIATPQAADRVQRLFISLSLHCLREAKDKKGKETRKGKGPGTGSKSKESPLCSSTLLVLPVPAPPLLLPISPHTHTHTPREVVCKFISELGSERNICVVPLESSYLLRSIRCDARI